MRNSKLVRNFFFCIALIVILAGDVLAAGVSTWVAQDATDPVPENSVLFIGSSTIRRWQNLCRDFTEYDVIQRGFGGSWVSDSNNYFNEIVAPYNPKAVVMFAGTNDIAGGETPEAVFDEYLEFVGRLDTAFGAGEVDFFYIGITPCESRQSTWDNAEALNTMVQNYATGYDHLHYIDTPSALMETAELGNNYPSSTLFCSDGLHLNEAGYDLFSSTVKAAINPVVEANIYTPNPLTPQPGQVIRFDFGPSNSQDGDHTGTFNGAVWNNWHEVDGSAEILAGERKNSLVDIEGNDTGIDLVITGGFQSNGKVNGGLLSPSEENLGDMAAPDATEDYFFIAATLDRPGAIMLSGLDPELTYDFKLFGTRATTSSRITTYVLEGADTYSADLQTSGRDIGSDGLYDGNDDTFAIFEGVQPDAYGKVFLDIISNDGSYAYLGAMEITVVPEPTTVSLILLGGVSLLLLRRRRRA